METWIILSLLSALFLGVYDIAKKKAVTGNAVPPVLLLNVSTAAAIWGTPVLIGFMLPDQVAGSVARLSRISSEQHFYLMIKSLMVGTSWTFAFFSLKHLPISIASPIRATSPMWTILVAVTFMNESPGANQWIGMAIVMTAFFCFSFVGAKEGIHFVKNGWVLVMVFATLIGAACGLYDKFLLQRLEISPMVVQAWFSIYLVPVMTPLTIYWWCFDSTSTRFKWRWSIPLIAIFLLIADYLYFCGLADKTALVSVVSTLRRTSVIIAFTYGVLQLKEKHWKAKLACIVGILIGVFFISQS